MRWNDPNDPMCKDVEAILREWKKDDHSLRSAWWYRHKDETRVLIESASFVSCGAVCGLRNSTKVHLTYPSVVVPVGVIDGEDIRAGRLEALDWDLATSVCVFRRQPGVR